MSDANEIWPLEGVYVQANGVIRLRDGRYIGRLNCITFEEIKRISTAPTDIPAVPLCREHKHSKVYAESRSYEHKQEGLFPWICRQCFAEGIDPFHIREDTPDPEEEYVRLVCEKKAHTSSAVDSVTTTPTSVPAADATTTENVTRLLLGAAMAAYLEFQNMGSTASVMQQLEKAIDAFFVANQGGENHD